MVPKLIAYKGFSLLNDPTDASDVLPRTWYCAPRPKTVKKQEVKIGILRPITLRFTSDQANSHLNCERLVEPHGIRLYR